ncbi:MAG: NPP1 family protein [Janthinobacterium lividum]
MAAVAVKAMPTKTTNSVTKTTNHLMPRTTLAYDDIVGFSQTVPSGTEGDLYTAYQPYLYVVNGCVPFPAVNAEGDISGGLPITGLTGQTDCTSSTGQVYGRAAAYGDYYAIMYAWSVTYFPARLLPIS